MIPWVFLAPAWGILLIVLLPAALSIWKYMRALRRVRRTASALNTFAERVSGDSDRLARFQVAASEANWSGLAVLEDRDVRRLLRHLPAWSYEALPALLDADESDRAILGRQALAVVPRPSRLGPTVGFWASDLDEAQLGVLRALTSGSFSLLGDALEHSRLVDPQLFAGLIRQAAIEVEAEERRSGDQEYLNELGRRARIPLSS